MEKSKLLLAELTVAVALVVASTPAWAARHAAETNWSYYDAAAQPSYPYAAKGRTTVHRSHRKGHAKASGKPQAARPATVAKAAPIIRAAPTSPAAAAEAFEDGMANRKPVVVAGTRPRTIYGTVSIDGVKFRFVSGGGGWSIPWGDYEISPGSEGSWGRRHDALDLTGTERGEIWDPVLRRKRLGIEIHRGNGMTEGCVAIDEWRRARRMIVAMIGKAGRAFLHVWPGHHSVTTSKSPDVLVVVVPTKTHLADRGDSRKRGRTAHRRTRYAGA